MTDVLTRPHVRDAITVHLASGRWSSVPALYLTLSRSGYAKSSIATQLANMENAGVIERRGDTAHREIKLMDVG